MHEKTTECGLFFLKMCHFRLDADKDRALIGCEKG